MKASSSLYFLIPYFSGVASICYYPDGSVSPQDTPCRDDTAQSTCCGQGYACLSNSICAATGKEIQKPGATLYVRGSCTDKTWRSGDCPLFCLNPQYDDVGGGEGIGKCPGENQLYYCIDSQPVNCSADKNVLIFEGKLPRDSRWWLR